jgi:NTP pyrophosphatase (non-canonical NTP hydrolase)
MSYTEFVNNQKLSINSKSASKFYDGLYYLESSFDQLPRLLAGAIGTSSEAGELLEKITPSVYTKDDAVDELGDVLFYTTVTQYALGIEKNITYDSLEYITFQYDILVGYNVKDAVIYLVVNASKYLDLIKKLLFQGKPLDESNLVKLRDLYHTIYKTILLITNLLDVTLEEVQQKNMDKLNARYKNIFSVQESENKVK